MKRDRLIWMALYAIWGLALAAVLSLLFLVPLGNVRWLIHVGWAFFAISALLGWAPILVFHRRGGVPKRKSYVHTTQLVMSGPYAIVRHPQYLAGDFIAVAVMCITQHWGAIAAGVIAIVSNRLSMRKADHDLVGRFGEPYREYMERVPRASLLVGLLRRARRRRGSG